MDKQRKILLNSIVVSFIIGVLLFVLLVSFAPNSSPYSANNYGSDGMQQLASKYQLNLVTSLATVPTTKSSVLLEIAPSIPFSGASIHSIRMFVENGGTLVLADDSGISNSLLQGLGVNIQIASQQVNDPLYNWQTPAQVIAPVSNLTSHEYSFLKGVSGLAFSYPSSLTISSSINVNVLALSSSYSYATVNSKGSIQNSSPSPIGYGPFPIVASQEIGSGLVIVIASSNLFANSIWTHADNQVFAGDLFTNSSVYLDTSQWPANTQGTVAGELVSIYGMLSSVPFRYFVAIGIVGVVVVFLRTFNGILNINASSPVRDTSGTLNNDILQHVRKDREKYGATS